MRIKNPKILTKLIFFYIGKIVYGHQITQVAHLQSIFIKKSYIWMLDFDKCRKFIITPNRSTICSFYITD